MNTTRIYERLKRKADTARPVFQKASKKRKKRKVQHQIVVACPSKVRKGILKSLRAASVSKISPARAETARKILAEIDKGNNLTKKSKAKKTNQIESAPAITEKQRSTLRIERFVLGLFPKSKSVFAGVRQRLCFGIGTSNVGQPVTS